MRLRRSWDLKLQLQAAAQGCGWCDLDELSHAVNVFGGLYHEQD